jgi:SAM-dependent methyltransferase
VSQQLPDPTLSPEALARTRRSRRYPTRLQFDYLHLRRLVDDLRAALAAVPRPVNDILDVYCGSRPYDDLMPEGARCVGLDVEGNPYDGIADVVSDDFLPFDDGSFDLVTCFEAFQYVEDPAAGVAELRRVLRPGGTALISVPFVWEYNRSILERRFTGPELADLFDGWDDVRVVENGGRAIAWATITGTLIERARLAFPRAVRPLLAPVYLLLNGGGAIVEALERRRSTGHIVLPMNLLVTARRPLDD